MMDESRAIVTQAVTHRRRSNVARRRNALLYLFYCLFRYYSLALYRNTISGDPMIGRGALSDGTAWHTLKVAR